MKTPTTMEKPKPMKGTPSCKLKERASTAKILAQSFTLALSLRQVAMAVNKKLQPRNNRATAVSRNQVLNRSALFIGQSVQGPSVN
jgi:hypothetical protein